MVTIRMQENMNNTVNYQIWLVFENEIQEDDKVGRRCDGSVIN